ncbi:MAG: glycosyltransferase family 4 protein [Thermoleophilia bacterium]|nr:glycosyltransferase family 4 protein [Thermoleophilia bacterium]
MRALSIAMVTEYAYPVLGGVSEHVHFLSRELARRGHDVTVVTGNVGDAGETAELDRQSHRDHGYRTTRIGRSVPVVANGSIARLTVALGIKSLISGAIRGMDVVHAQGLASPTLPMGVLRVSTAPCTVGTFHTYFDEGHWLYDRIGPYVRNSLARLDRRIAVSEACIDALGDYFPGEWDVVPNGIDCSLYRPLGPAEERPPGPPRILFVGRFDPRNALGDLLEAAAILKAEGREFTVQVIGDGPARPVYERKARSLDIWDRVEWLGLLNEERPRFYREADVMAAPCVLASFGVVLLEALASGTPVVAADNVGFGQVIRGDVPGRFVPPHDPAELARGIAEVLDDPAAAEDISRRGRTAVEREFDWPRVTDQVERIYREVLEAKRPAVRTPIIPTSGGPE